MSGIATLSKGTLASTTVGKASLNEKEAAHERECQRVAGQVLADASPKRGGTYVDTPGGGSDRVRQLGAMGWAGFLLSKGLGGRGGTLIEACLAAEAFARRDPSAALLVASQILCGRLVEALGTDEQKQRLVPALASVQAVAAVCVSEPHAGSDVRAIRTTAKPGTTHLELAGQKAHVANAGQADAYFVLAREARESTSRANASEAAQPTFTVFVVPATAIPSERIAIRRTMGLDGCAIGSLRLDGVVVAGDSRLGDEASDHLETLLNEFIVTRCWVTAMATGIVEECLSRTLDRAQSREQFGRSIGSFQAIGHRVADMAIEASRNRLLMISAARICDPSSSTRYTVEERRYISSAAKVAATEAARKAANVAIQVFGAEGYYADSGLPELLQAARGLEILEGTSEMHREIIGSSFRRAARNTVGEG